MALLVGGEVDAAERAYGWLAPASGPTGRGRSDGGRAWSTTPARETNMCAYVAVGVWHH